MTEVPDSHSVIEAMTLHAVFAGRYSAAERQRALRDSHIGCCAIQDCARPVAKWITSEMAPGRPMVYGVCGADAAAILLHEHAQS